MCSRALIEGGGLASAAFMAVPGAAGAIPSGIAAAFLFLGERADRKRFREMSAPTEMWTKEEPSEPPRKILPYAGRQLRLK